MGQLAADLAHARILAYANGDAAALVAICQQRHILRNTTPPDERRILDALRKAPLTITDITKATGLENTRPLVGRMHRDGALHPHNGPKQGSTEWCASDGCAP